MQIGDVPMSESFDTWENQFRGSWGSSSDQNRQATLPGREISAIGLLKEYKDVFASLYNDMQGLNSRYYQHYMHLN